MSLICAVSVISKTTWCARSIFLNTSESSSLQDSSIVNTDTLTATRTYGRSRSKRKTCRSTSKSMRSMKPNSSPSCSSFTCPERTPSFWQGLRNARQHLSERPRSAGTPGLLLSAFVPLAYWQFLQLFGCPIDRCISDRLDRVQVNPQSTLRIDTRLAGDPLQLGRVQRSDTLVNGVTESDH